MATAVGESEKYHICHKFYNPLDSLVYPPTCSQECWWIWTHAIHHGGSPCWIPGCSEVDCGVRTPGYCDGCKVFKAEKSKGKYKDSPKESY